MRFSSTAITAPLVLLTSYVFADTCTCPSNEGAVAQAASSFNDGASQPYVYTPPPVVQVPSVPPTQKNLNNGAQQALDNMAAQGVIPAELAQPIADAVKAQIAEQAAKQQVVYAAAGTTVTTTVTPQTTVLTTMSAGQQVTITATQTITSLPPGATILSNKTLVALADIQQTINDAIAAVNLSKTGLDANAQAEVQKCLNAVLTNGGLPAGYSCISQSGSTSSGLQATFNNILEQFLGILPAKLIDDIQDAVMPMLGGLLPDETTLVNNVNSAIRSVVSSASGGSVTAIEMMQSCYNMAIRQNGNTSYLQCYMANGGPFSVLQSAMNGVIEQFVGVLPGNLLASVANLTSSTLQAGAFSGTSSIATNMTSQIDAVLASVTASLTGNSVTLMEQLQQCANKVLQSGNATAAQDCIVKNAAVTAQTMADSLAQQYSGFLPASFLSDMKQVIDGMNSTGNFTPDQLKAALEKANNNANMGPQFTTCFLQVQSCLTAQIQATGNISAVCSGPIAGCELIGSQNASSPNATLAGILDGTLQNTTVSINTSSSMISSSVAATRALSAASSSSSSSSSSAAAPASSSSSSVAAASSSSAPVIATTTSSVSASTSTTPPAPATTSSSAAAAVSSSSSAASTSTTMRIRRGHKRLRMAYADHYNGI